MNPAEHDLAVLEQAAALKSALAAAPESTSAELDAARNAAMAGKFRPWPETLANEAMLRSINETEEK